MKKCHSHVTVVFVSYDEMIMKVPMVHVLRSPQGIRIFFYDQIAYVIGLGSTQAHRHMCVYIGLCRESYFD